MIYIDRNAINTNKNVINTNKNVINTNRHASKAPQGACSSLYITVVNNI